ncbi:hypothetical protein SERLA73DRAFT_182186 [Serpula lacrymans var. lacrymans S7.3]|uniref:Uncharacterized protein n=2 Tax=Serpula lacrymans var. lacrymans TaxID=341189 RepID=F8PWU2_SERL3|nr:uncharacterized protein SERLADRAFT_468724 [Serpula lacrymans var. lacrymans S7.9]EGN99269.1 hypothetical protein SERLA73DRAFT_182186 [Serpula lacrymans var. lacrymans S7.3]EGO24834.1 hypothetical protein SERLADRAFT_468724 [Serpula lacrymans var. lacrymans S7.9]
MYSNGLGATSPGQLELSNNPFIEDPSNPHTRFPDITGSISSPPPQPQYQGQASYGNGHQGQPQYQQPYQNQAQYQNPQYQNQNQYQTPYQGQPQLQTQYASSSTYGPQYAGSPVSLAPQPTGRPFQPSSSFGQHLVSQVDSSQQQQYQQPQQYGGYQQGYQPAYPNQQSQQFTGYPNTGYNQGQQQQNTGYLSEFDPYSSLGQGQAQGAAPSHARTPSSSGNAHPRDFIRTHKTELEAWDSYSWKQLFNAFDALKEAWGTRKREIEARISALGGNGAPGLFGQSGYGGYQGGYGGYGSQQEVERLKGLLREVESHHDTVAASSLQLHEVYQYYRQSGDAASKRRVRESCNAALTGLPDLPGAW